MEREEKLELLTDVMLVAYGIKPAFLRYVTSSKEVEEIIEVVKDFCCKMNINNLGYFVCCNKIDEEPKKIHWIAIGQRRVLELLPLIAIFNEKGYFKEKYKSILMEALHGYILGYPLCCIKNFILYDGDLIKVYKHYKKQLKGKDKYNIRLVKERLGKKKILKILKDTIYHIPCSPDCEETAKLYKTYKKWRKKIMKILRKNVSLHNEKV